MEKIQDFQADDIDLFVHRKDTGPLWIELKIDSYSSGNLFLEIIGNDNTNTEGCIYQAKSSHVCYYFDACNEVYVLPTIQLQQWLKKNEGRFRHIQVPTNRDPIRMCLSRLIEQTTNRTASLRESKGNWTAWST